MTPSRLQALVSKWRDAAVWEHDDMSNTQSAQAFDQCADELAAVLAAEGGADQKPKCSCWIGRAEAHGGWAPDRIVCSVHGEAALTRPLQPQEAP